MPICLIKILLLKLIESFGFGEEELLKGFEKLRKL